VAVAAAADLRPKQRLVGRPGRVQHLMLSRLPEWEDAVEVVEPGVGQDARSRLGGSFGQKKCVLMYCTIYSRQWLRYP